MDEIILKGAKFAELALDTLVSKTKKPSRETLDAYFDLLKKYQASLDRERESLKNEREGLEVESIVLERKSKSQSRFGTALSLGKGKIPKNIEKPSLDKAENTFAKAVATVGLVTALPAVLGAATIGVGTALLSAPLILPVLFKNELLLKKKLEEVHYTLDNYKQAELLISELAVRFLNNVHTENQMSVESKFEFLRERIHLIFFLVHREVYVNKNPDIRVLFLFAKHLLIFTTDFYDDKYHLDFQIIVSELMPLAREKESLKYEIKCLKEIISEFTTIEENQTIYEANYLNKIAKQIQLGGEKVTYERVAQALPYKKNKPVAPSTFKGRLKRAKIMFDGTTERFYPIQRKS
ncbi:MAG: hypothetical protein WC209_04635 [Ignavibacteriaceae bacterium]|jgi:hypothetical protein